MSPIHVSWTPGRLPCLHNRSARKAFVLFDITAKKENAVEMWEETPAVGLFVEVCVTEELGAA